MIAIVQFSAKTNPVTPDQTINSVLGYIHATTGRIIHPVDMRIGQFCLRLDIPGIIELFAIAVFGRYAVRLRIVIRTRVRATEIGHTVFAFQPAMFQDEIGIMTVLSHPGLVKGKIRIIAVAAARVKAVLCCGIAYRPAGKFLARRRILFFIIADLESAVAGVIATIFICFDFTAIGTSLGSVFTTAVVAHFAETLSQMVHADLHHLSLPQTRSSRPHRITAGIDGKTGKCSTAADQWR